MYVLRIVRVSSQAQASSCYSLKNLNVLITHTNKNYLLIMKNVLN